MSALLLLIFSLLNFGAVAGLIILGEGGLAEVRTICFILLGAAGFFSAVIFSRETRACLVLILFSSSLPLAIGEWFFSFTRTYPNFLSALQEGQEFDLRSEFERVLDDRKRGVAAYPTLDPAYCLTGNRWRHTLLPLASMSKTSLVDCNESGEYATYTSDEHGFRNPPGLYTSPLEVAILGDSFAHGACVPEGHDVGSWLRQKIPGTLNISHGGNGPLLNLATLVEYAIPLRPRHVLWLHYEGNDFKNLKVEKNYPVLNRYLTKKEFSQKLVQRQPEIDKKIREHIDAEIERRATWRVRVKEAFLSTVSFVSLYQLRETLKQALFAEKPENLSVDIRENFVRVMMEAQERVRVAGGQLVVVYLPEYRRFGSTNYPDGQRQTVSAVLARLGLPMVDISQRMLAGGDPLRYFPFRRKNHYNSEGYRLVADAIYEFISAGSPTADAEGEP